LSLVLYGGGVWEANASGLSGGRVKFEFFWNAEEGNVSGQSVTLQRTTAGEVLAGAPAPLLPEGTWQLEEMYVDEAPVAMTDCETGTIFTFLANATFTGQQFYYNEATCQSTGYSGTWEETDTDEYEMTTEGGGVRTLELIDAETMIMSYDEVWFGEPRFVEILLRKV